MCASIGAAVRELEEETSGKAEFEIITGSLEELKPQVAVYDLGDTHGLVALDAKGQLVAKLPGHAYGKPEVAEVLGKLLPR